MLTVEQRTAKWKLGIENSVDAAKASVAALTESPAQQAINAKALMITNWKAAVENGTKFEEGLQPFVNLANWQERYNAGIENNRTLPDSKTAKIEDHFELQDSVFALSPQVISLINAGSNGVTKPTGLADRFLNVAVNATLNQHISAFDLNTTASEALTEIIPSLIADWGFT